jgi:hypothetical protein
METLKPAHIKQQDAKEILTKLASLGEFEKDKSAMSEKLKTWLFSQVSIMPIMEIVLSTKTIRLEKIQVHRPCLTIRVAA